MLKKIEPSYFINIKTRKKILSLLEEYLDNARLCGEENYGFDDDDPIDIAREISDILIYFYVFDEELNTVIIEEIKDKVIDYGKEAYDAAENKDDDYYNHYEFLEEDIEQILYDHHVVVDWAD